MIGHCKYVWAYDNSLVPFAFGYQLIMQIREGVTFALQGVCVFAVVNPIPVSVKLPLVDQWPIDRECLLRAHTTYLGHRGSPRPCFNTQICVWKKRGCAEKKKKMLWWPGRLGGC